MFLVKTNERTNLNFKKIPKFKNKKKKQKNNVHNLGWLTIVFTKETTFLNCPSHFIAKQLFSIYK